MTTEHKSLWKQRNFMLLWSGQFFSWMGTEVSAIAMPLAVLGLTGSAAQAGTVAAIRGLVYVFWAIPAGVLLDRWDRKMVMFIANLGSGLAMTGIALGLAFHELTMLQLYIACVVEGSCFVFANLGRFASFRKVVSDEQLPAASAQGEAAGHVGTLIGPPLGGFLYQSAGGFVAFLADGLSYFINAFSIFFINTPLGTETPKERKAIHHEVKEAITWLRGEPTKRFLNAIYAGRTVVMSGLYLLIVVVAKEHHIPALSIGFIFTGGAVGGILGSVIAAKVHSRFRLKQLLTGICLLSLLVFGLYAVSVNVVVLALVTALFYGIDPLWEVSTFAHPVAFVPDHIRGRVLSLTRMVLLAAQSFGLFITGVILHYLSANWAIGIFSGLLFVLFVAVATNKKLARF